MKLKDCIKWLWNASCGLRLPVVTRGLVGVLRVAVSLAFVWVSMHLVDIATGESADSMSAGIAMLVACLLVQLLLLVSGSVLDVRTDMNLTNVLRYRLFNHVMMSRWQGRESMHTGDVLNRLDNDVNTVSYMLCKVLPSVMTTSIQLIAAFLFLASLDIRLAGILLFIMPVALLLSKSYMRKMRRLTREIRDTDSRVQTHLQENLQHRTLVSTMENTERVTDRLNELQQDLKRRVLHRNDYSLFSRSMVQLGFSAGYATAFLWGIFGLRDGAVTFGVMTAFLQLVSQVQRPIVDLSRQIPSFIHTVTAVERLSELEEFPQEEQGESVKLQGHVGVKLENVSFTYPEGQHEVLSDFSYDFRPGSLTAIVGETGVGKSTLIRIILALLLPQKGKVQFYNDKEAVTASPLTRCNVVYVPQGNTLMSGTIRENLLMGNPEATDEQLRMALHTAVAEFVYDLPDGLETLCGEGGAGLSEGQAQRIAIARGLLRTGGIILLDEPTSSVDNDTEEIMLRRLSEQVGDKTLLLVTHREKIASLCTSTVRLV